MYSREGAKDYNASKNRSQDILPCKFMHAWPRAIDKMLHLGMLS